MVIDPDFPRNPQVLGKPANNDGQRYHFCLGFRKIIYLISTYAKHCTVLYVNNNNLYIPNTIGDWY